MRSFECSQDVIEAYQPAGTAHTWHTNHPLVNTNTTGADEQLADSDPLATTNSAARLDSVASRLDNAPATVDAALDALRACDDDEHPVCRGPEKGDAFTYAATVAALRPEEIDWYVTDGPPDRAEPSLLHLTPESGPHANEREAFTHPRGAGSA